MDEEDNERRDDEEQSEATSPGDEIASGLAPEVAAHAALLDEYLRTDVDAVVHVLRPLAALREVGAVCESVRGGREPPQPHDRRSLRADAQLLSRIGDELKHELQPTLHDYFHGEVADLVELFEDRGGVVRLLNATKVLIDRFRRPASSQAAWRDLLADVRRGAEPELSRLRALQLREARGEPRP